MGPLKKKTVTVGDIIGGKYRVERELGRGGVGVVVQARHMELDQPVAIKVLMLRDKEQVARFVHEARACVRLRGEHVAKVSDVGRLSDGTPYMVMEFLEGSNLSKLTDRGPLSVQDAATYLLQACEGIAEAHALGIVHRDIKPANLFLTRNAAGRPLVKVLDFGIAKQPEAPPGGAVAETRLTRALAVLGSPPYMSPEQVRASRDVDVRSDVWSLGVSLYELLTARVPFDGPTVQDVCARILTEPAPPLVRWRPELPGGLQEIIDRCLAKDPAERYGSVWEVALAMEPFAPPTARNAERVREILFTPPPSDWRHNSPISAPLSGPMSAHAPTEETGETGTAFGGGSRRTIATKRVMLASAAAAAGLGLLVVAWLHGARRVHAPSPEGSAAYTAVEAPATTTRTPPSGTPHLDAPSAAATQAQEPLAETAPPAASASTPAAPTLLERPNPSTSSAPRPTSTPRPVSAPRPASPPRPAPSAVPAAHPESTKM